MRSFFIIFLLTCWMIEPLQSNEGRFHAIFLLDNQARQIERVVEANLAKMDELIEEIADHTALPLHKYLLKADQLQTAELYTFLDQLDIQPDDLVLFYFSGHGFRTLSKEDNPWPNLYLTKDHVGFDFQELAETLRLKNPRFLLALADCCNNHIPEKLAPPLLHKGSALTRMPLVIDYSKGYQRLFLNFNGTIMITSAYQGEFSWGTIQGGLYTLGFLDSLQEGALKDKDWDEILDQASLRVVEHQNPYFVISPSTLQ